MSLAAQAQIQVDTPVGCTSYTSTFLGRDVGYCVDRSRPDLPAKSGEPVVYFFHGMGGGRLVWFEGGYSRLMHQTAQLPAFTVVSFSTTPTSFFSDKGALHSGADAWETWFVNEFVPFVESRLDVCTQASCRSLAGLSMGGYGAIKIALRYPDLVSQVAASSPALAAFNVFADDATWEDYFSRHTIGKKGGMMLLGQVRKVFRDAADYSEQNPILLTQSRDERSPKWPRLFFSVGGKDEFGFNEGAQLFTDALIDKGIDFESVYDPEAGHLGTTALRRSLLDFLVRGIKKQGK